MVSLLSGAQKFQHMHMELLYGKASVNFGIILLRTSDLEWGMAPTSNFWENIWLGDTTLGEDFPRLHITAAEPDSTIASNRLDNI